MSDVLSVEDLVWVVSAEYQKDVPKYPLITIDKYLFIPCALDELIIRRYLATYLISANKLDDYRLDWTVHQLPVKDLIEKIDHMQWKETTQELPVVGCTIVTSCKAGQPDQAYEVNHRIVYVEPTYSSTIHKLLFTEGAV